MESLGQKLREAREQHNFSLEQVARDTHISKQYLEALETEEFSKLPGETYLIGFLRNYAEYLSLNAEEVVTLYRNIQIQEQPLPMTELLEPDRRSGFPRFLLLLVLILAVLGAGGYLLYRYVIAPTAEAASQSEAVQETVEIPEQQEVIFEDEAMTRWFSLDDTILFPLNGNTYRLHIVEMDSTLIVKVPGGSLDMPVGQDRRLDVNGDGRNDLRILLNDLDAAGSTKRANISLYKITKAIAPQVAVTAEGGQSEASAEPATEDTATAAPAAVAVAGAASAEVIPIITAESPGPFRVSISFRGYCLFRYLVDNDIREERFFHKGESFSLDAKNEVRLWISNAGVVRLMVSGRELEVGRPGAVTAKQIRWRRDEGSGQYLLEAVARE